MATKMAATVVETLVLFEPRCAVWPVPVRRRMPACGNGSLPRLWSVQWARWRWDGPTREFSTPDHKAIQREVEQALRLLAVFGACRGEGDAFQGGAEVGGPDIGTDFACGRAGVHE